MKSKGVSSRLLVLSSVGLLIIILLKIFWFSGILKFFPFAMGDLSERIGQFYLFVQNGFLGHTNQWFGGDVVLRYYPPGWFFFTYAFYYLVKGVLLSVFLSLVGIIVLTFAAVFFLRRYSGLSFAQSLFFSSFFFASPVAVSLLFHLGKLPEFFGWMFFIIMFFVSLYYVKRKLTYPYLLVPICFFVLLLTHPYVMVPASLIFVSLFVSKKGLMDRVLVVASALVPILLSLFWWIPFFSLKSSRVGYVPSRELLGLGSIASFNTILVLLFFILFFIYHSSVSSFDRKRVLLFYLPFLVLGAIDIFRVLPLVPVLNQLVIGAYNILFLILCLFLFMKIEWFRYGANVKKLLIVLLLLAPFVFYFFSFGYFSVPELDGGCYDNIVGVLDDVNNNYVVLLESTSGYSANSFVSYLTLNKPNLITPFGAYGAGFPSEKRELMDKMFISLKSDCDGFKNLLDESGVVDVVSSGSLCERLEACGLVAVKESNDVCLFGAS